MKKFKKLFFIILGILVCLSINFSYAIDLNLLDSTNLESNSIPNESYANNANSNVNTSNSITNNSTNSEDNSGYNYNNNLASNYTNSSSSYNISNINSIPESELGLTNILNILLIVIGILLVLFGIAILIRLKR